MNTDKGTQALGTLDVFVDLDIKMIEKIQIITLKNDFVLTLTCKCDIIF